MKKLISTIVALAACLSFMIFPVAASAAETEYMNAAKKEYFVAKEGPNCSIKMEDVTDYKGVKGDTGVLVTMSPVAKDSTFTNGYVYMNTPVDVKNVTVSLKLLGPAPEGKAGMDAQGHFNNKVQWWTVGFHQKANTDIFAEAAKSVTYMTWGMKTKLMTNGFWQGDGELSCYTDWGAFPAIGDHTFGLSASKENPDNFAFKADGIFPAQCDPYAGTQADKAAAIKPFNMHVSDFENGKAYLTIGMAQPCVAGQNCEDFVVLIKNVNVAKVYPESVKIGNGSITELEKKIGDKFTLKAVLSPAEGITESKIVWSSDKEDVVKVNAETGEVEVLKEGEANITVTTVNGKTASIKIKVVTEEKPVEPETPDKPDPETPDKPDPETPDKPEEKGGCGSVVVGSGMAAFAVVSALAGAGVVTLRKRNK